MKKKITKENLVCRANIIMCDWDLLNPSFIRPSVKTVFSEPVKHINAKFDGKVSFHHISGSFFFCFVFQNFAFLIFYDFFSLSLTWDHMGEKISNDISSESAQQICSQKFMHTARKGLYQSCIKNCEISNFVFWQFFCSFFLMFHMGINWEL